MADQPFMLGLEEGSDQSRAIAAVLRAPSEALVSGTAKAAAIGYGHIFRWLKDVYDPVDKDESLTHSLNRLQWIAEALSTRARSAPPGSAINGYAPARTACMGELDAAPLYSMLVHLGAVCTSPNGSAGDNPFIALCAHVLELHLSLSDRIAESNDFRSAIRAATRFARQCLGGEFPDLIPTLPSTPLTATEYHELVEELIADGGVTDRLQTVRALGRYALQERPPIRREGTQRPNTPPGPTIDEPPAKPGVSGKNAKERIRSQLRSQSAVNPRQQQEMLDDGLARTEIRPRRPIVRAPPRKPRQTGMSLSARARINSGMLRAIANRNQHLPVAPQVLRPGEIAALAQALLPALDSPNAHNDRGNRLRHETALATLLILCTGARLAEVHATPIVIPRERMPDRKRALLLPGPGAPLQMWIPVIPPDMQPGRYVHAQEALERTRSDGFTVAFPPDIATRIVRVRNLDPPFNDSLFSQPLEEIQASLQDSIRRFNLKHHARISLRRLHQVLPDTIRRLASDDSQALLLTSDSDPGIHAQLVYQTTLISTLRATYQRALEAILPNWDLSRPETLPPLDGDDAPSVGSTLHVHDWALKIVVKRLQSELAKPRPETQPLVSFHNRFVGYVWMMLAFATGIRAIRNPLDSLLDVDWSCGLIYVEDKFAKSAANQRVLALAPTAFEQLVLYRRHLAALCDLIPEPETQSAIRWTSNGQSSRVPFLFFLSKNLAPQPLTPANIGIFLQSCFVEIPANLGRHGLRTELHRAGCPDEWIDATLGHDEIGTEPLGRYSAMSIADRHYIARTYIEPMLQRAGWKPLAGLPSR